MADDAFHEPPRRRNHEGAARHVGVEIEYVGPSAAESAAIVRDLFGGTVESEDQHRHLVRDSELGDFTCELDTRYAHPKADDKSPGLRALEQRLGGIIGQASAPLVPTEITCPPLALDALPRLPPLIVALREAGAHGTEDRLAYAFALQLNPEIAEREAAWLTAVLRAYLVLSDWLRAKSDIDFTRRLFGFADPFPGEYIRLVCDPAYAPDTGRLIEDYLAHNPTRNRELDLLPLFAWLDPGRVRAKIDDGRIKPRPAFHYRLPDARVGDPGWSIAADWNRWVTVERLAEDSGRLNRMAADFLDSRGHWLGGSWADKAEAWLAG